LTSAREAAYGRGPVVSSAVTYSDAKLWAIAITALLVILFGGALVPLVARWRAGRLESKLRTGTGDAESRRRLEARLQHTRRLADDPGLSALLGADGRLSTSKSIAALWTALIVWVLAALILAWPEDWNAALAQLWPNYLLFIGGPYAALVFAKAAVSSKTGNGTLQKPPADGYVRLSDLLGDDRGQRDLVDIQFVLFNLVAVGFVIAAVVRAGLPVGFPEIPAGLITLTAGPAAVYTANKGLISNRAVVLSVVPSLVRKGDLFMVRGANFLPGTDDDAPAVNGVAPAADPKAGDAAASVGTTVVTNPPDPKTDAGVPEAPIVEIGGLTVDRTSTTSTAIQARADAPPGSANRPLAVSVVTESGQRATLLDALTVLTDPIAIALDRGAAKSGDRVTLTGSWSSAPGVTVVVLVDALAAVIDSQPTPGTSLTFIVPQLRLLPRVALVKLVVGSLASGELELEVVS
jgi:hypothetical protein